MILKLKPQALNTLVNAGYTMNMIACMPRRDIVDAWLTYEGIIGYTDKIIELVDSTREEGNVK